VAELTASAQVKLLRVIQEKNLFRLGGSIPIGVDIRVLAATHRNLSELVRKRRFREDLWFRLNVFPIHIPALRERKQDIPNLVDYLMMRKSKEMHLPFIPRLAEGSIESMMSYRWPGNIREIDNLIERNLIICNGKPLTFPELSRHYYAKNDENVASEACIPLDQIIIAHVKKALELSNGKISGKDGAAQLLGINPSTLRGKMRKHNIIWDNKNGSINKH